MKMLENLKDIYHVCSEGLKTRALFKNNEEFIYGMNAAALCRLSSQTDILCFCLMDNHVHFILNSTYEECRKFIIKYKHLLAIRNRELKEDIKISIKPANNHNHTLNAIAYVIRNPIAAGYQYMPDSYPWSSSGLYFKSDPHLGGYTEKVSDMTLRQVQQTLHTRQRVPGDWTLNRNGMIWPGHYVDYESVNRLFRSPKRFLYYMSVTQDTILMEPTFEENPAILRDKELREMASVLSEKTFGISDINSLNGESRLSLAKILRRQCGCTNRQLARTLHLEIRDFI